jgi:hypothetical protein
MTQHWGLVQSTDTPGLKEKCLENTVFCFFDFAVLGFELSLHLKPLHQPFFFFCDFFFFLTKIASGELFAQGWLQTSILLISAS